MKFTVPRSSPTVLATTGASLARRRTLAGVSRAFASCSTHIFRVERRAAFTQHRDARGEAGRAVPTRDDDRCDLLHFLTLLTPSGWSCRARGSRDNSLE